MSISLRRAAKALRRDPVLHSDAAGTDPAARAGVGGSPDAGTVVDASSIGGAVGVSTAPRVVDPDVLALAHRIASRLSVPRNPHRSQAVPGSEMPISRKYRGGSDEVDIERTVEELVGSPVITADSVVVHERFRRTRTLLLLVDISGSMGPERIRTAAASVGALTGLLPAGSLAVVAFWSDASMVLRLGEHSDPAVVMSRILAIDAKGLTNVSYPLEVARTLVPEGRGRESRVLLLSDCVHNAGPDPAHAAGALRHVDVLIDVSGEHDLLMARRIARVGRGRLAVLRTYRDVAPALRRILTSAGN